MSIASIAPHFAVRRLLHRFYVPAVLCWIPGHTVIARDTVDGTGRGHRSKPLDLLTHHRAAAVPFSSTTLPNTAVHALAHNIAGWDLSDAAYSSYRQI